MEAARSLAVESGVTSVTLTAVANRAGVHYSAVRRYFSSHKEVLLHLAAEGWTRWSATVCAALAEPGPAPPPEWPSLWCMASSATPCFAIC
ncbi:tetR-family transcriptional regulator [Mycobacteroides abscessus subsp. bolletii 1513]|uniref:TetR-family transcriptional regulator n=1 Tax=Mycobacteroides abscessus subsp. bolletii 1513 TaxID=1299321 RepID=X8DWA8_9MYCO|nr:tetR-family transcriptional regulator [Mycobacteroides abscessus subsp. bolletii 1513]